MPAQPPSSDDTSNTSATPTYPAQLSSVVLAVRDLEDSSSFYCDLLGMHVAISDTSAALLASRNSFQLYLHALGTRAPHALDSVGIHAVFWTTHDAEDLHRCEQLLHARSAHVHTWNVAEYTAVEGRDPDGLPVLLVHPGPDEATRHQILSRIYAL